MVSPVHASALAGSSKEVPPTHPTSDYIPKPSRAHHANHAAAPAPRRHMRVPQRTPFSGPTHPPPQHTQPSPQPPGPAPTHHTPLPPPPTPGLNPKKQQCWGEIKPTPLNPPPAHPTGTGTGCSSPITGRGEGGGGGSPRPPPRCPAPASPRFPPLLQKQLFLDGGTRGVTTGFPHMYFKSHSKAEAARSSLGREGEGGGGGTDDRKIKITTKERKTSPRGKPAGSSPRGPRAPGVRGEPPVPSRG